MSVTRRAIAAAVAITALVAGCTNDESPPPTPPDSEGDAAPADDPTTEDEAPDVPDTPHGTIQLAGRQQAHLNGVLVAVAGITVDDHGDVYVEFEAQNVNTRSVYLLSDGARLEDDLGNTYQQVRAESNRQLQIPSDHRAEVSLAFHGPIDPDATRVSLGLNTSGEFLEVDARPPTTFDPTFAFRDLPLPGVGLDDEGAGDDDDVGIDLSIASVTVEDASHVGPIDTLIEVREIRSSALVVEVDVFVRNDSDRSRNLIARNPLLWAETDGQPTEGLLRYALLRTEEGGRDSMTLQPGEELEATLSFRGVIPPDATGLRLGVGNIRGRHLRAGEGDEDESSLSPSAVFTGLPVPEGVDDGD